MPSVIRDLFPFPSHHKSRLVPVHWPGNTPESTLKLQAILRENHEKWHVFLNDKGFHNHVSHRVLALWVLGADDNVIQAAYDKDLQHQKLAFASPELVTIKNYNDHLGDDRFYNAYLTFFEGEVRQRGMSSTLEEYIFSYRANYGSKSVKGEYPEMLSRFVAVIIHPLIHCGYGAEFNIPGMMIEGLAQAAVHRSGSSPILPPSLFLKDPSTVNGKNIAHTSGDVHAFTILARILEDPELVGEEHEDGMYSYWRVLEVHGEKLLKLANAWTLDTSDPKNVERKIEELQWICVMMYALGGFRPGKDFNADFYLVHVVTSSLFIPALAEHLSPSAKEILLRSYFTVSLAYWISRGRPNLDAKSFFSADTARISLGSGSSPDLTLLLESPVSSNPNPWLAIIHHTIVHPDDHLAKCQRALAHYAMLYGSRQPGFFAGTGLPGTEKVDGTLFVRAAGLTAKRLGRERDDEPFYYWDARGFYDEVGNQ